VRAVELRDRRRQLHGRVLVLRDITRYVEMEAVLRSLATIDELTGIPNRRHFLELTARGLAQAKRHRRPVAMAIFDLDRFKLVNDTHGHQAGDALLRSIAHAAAATVRTGDVIGRFGGEEFAVFLPDTDHAGATAFGERLRAAIAAARVDWRGRTLRVTASVGVVTAPGIAAPTLDQLIAAADSAQYAAKARGGDAVEVAAWAPAVGA
jgi:diguanylate cyclase (GGDEF)-like protein